MSEKGPDFTPAPSILPEGMYGPDNFAVSNSQTRVFEQAHERGFKVVDKADLPAVIQDKLGAHPDDSVYLASESAGYKAYTREKFDKIQEFADKQREDERSPIYSEAQAQVIDQLVEQHKSPEDALLEARTVLTERLQQFEENYSRAVEADRRSLKGRIDELPGVQRRANYAVEEAYGALRRGANQPESAYSAIANAIDQLQVANRSLTMVDEIAHGANLATGRLLDHARDHKDGVGRLDREFTALVSRVSETNEADPIALSDIGNQPVDAMARQTKAAEMLETSTGVLREALGRSIGVTEEARQRTRSMIHQLEDMSHRVRLGRVSSDEYMTIVRSVQQLSVGLKDGAGQTRRIASAAEEL